MNWTALLSNETQVKRRQRDKCFDKYPISDFEKDYKNIILGSAFRRLQDKTQVFPLDKSDFVRTRLTHSIEVSTIARQLGLMLVDKTEHVNKEISDDNYVRTSIPTILSCAGLLHDLGNPPFGHFGEVIIGEWFKENLEKDTLVFKGESVNLLLTPQMKKDLCNFEGNAQAFRILSKAKNNGGGYDMNITYATLNALIKYPTNSLEFDKTDKNVKNHKLGYFYSEKDIIDEVCGKTGTKISTQKYVRHPLTYLMEAADDIAYVTSDLEDAFKKEVFTMGEFKEYFKNEISEYEKNSEYEKRITHLRDIYKQLEKEILKNDSEGKEKELISFQIWMEYTRDWLMYAVSYSFSINYTNIMEGKYEFDLFYGTNHEMTVKVLKGAMRKFVFDSPEILKLELSAKKILSTLLECFINAVIEWDANDSAKKDGLNQTNRKYLNIISENYRNDYKKSMGTVEEENLYLRFLMVTDFISGMTDSYAKNLYQELCGID